MRPIVDDLEAVDNFPVPNLVTMSDTHGHRDSGARVRVRGQGAFLMHVILVIPLGSGHCPTQWCPYHQARTSPFLNNNNNNNF